MSHHFTETAKHLLSPSKGRMCEGKEPGGLEICTKKISSPNVMDILGHTIYKMVNS